MSPDYPGLSFAESTWSQMMLQVNLLILRLHTLRPWMAMILGMLEIVLSAMDIIQLFVLKMMSGFVQVVLKSSNLWGHVDGATS